MEESTAPTAVVAQPRTVVIERRWAIVGGAVIATLIIALGVALAIVAGDDGPDGPPGFQLSAQEGYGPGFAPPGSQQAPQGVPPMPQGPAAPIRPTAAAPIRTRPRRCRPRPAARAEMEADRTGSERPRRGAGSEAGAA